MPTPRPTAPATFERTPFNDEKEDLAESKRGRRSGERGRSGACRLLGFAERIPRQRRERRERRGADLALGQLTIMGKGVVGEPGKPR